MISHKYKCIFIHIPKNGGTSIEKKLELFDKLQRDVQDHRPIRKMRGAIPEYIFQNYFKFTFVRNPWARVFSWYRNIMKDPIHRKNLKIPNYCSFRQFVKYRLRNIWALRPQLYFITDKKGDVIVDFIGRFERLEEDFSKVCDILSIKDKTLPKLLFTPNCNYIPFYDEKTRKIVAKFYRHEIKRFGYQFEDDFYMNASSGEMLPISQDRSFILEKILSFIIIAGSFLYMIQRILCRTKAIVKSIIISTGSKNCN